MMVSWNPVETHKPLSLRKGFLFFTFELEKNEERDMKLLKYITDYIADLHCFLTIVSKIITISITIPNNNVVACAYTVINLERVMLAAGNLFQNLNRTNVKW